MSKLLILDKDHTLVKPASGGTFPQHPTDQALLPGVAEAVAHYAQDGWTICIASNQGGVMHGYKTLEDAIAEMRYCMELLRPIIGSSVNEVSAYFCPDNGETCWQVKGDTGYYPARQCGVLADGFRKPDPGMLVQAIEEHSPMFADYFAKVQGTPKWQESSVLYVGDLDTDRQCAENAGVAFMWASNWVKPFVEDE